MQKIPTIFDRDWDGNRGVVDKLTGEYDFANAVATEKVDGTNVRVTIFEGKCTNLDKRRSPKGKEPFYIQADKDDPGDKWIFKASEILVPADAPDGVWEGEAVGPKIQGNPLNLEEHQIILFSLPRLQETLLRIDNAPTTFSELLFWIPDQPSAVGQNCMIEGVVWHWPDGTMAKIKTKDFK